MELREGYKHTEVPIIPEDWEEINLDGLVKNNGLIRGPFGGSLKKEVFVESGIKIYEQKNAIYQNVEIGTYFINEEKYKELNRFEVFENDFILSCSGTIGRIFRIPQNHPKGIINQALLIIRLNNSLIDFDYFYYQFINEPFQNRIIDDTQGGAMKNLVGMSEFKKVKIPLPPTKAEQTAIATALSDADALINSLEKLIAKKRNIKQGAMQQLLKPKEGWEVKKLGDFLDYEQPTEYLVTDTEYNDNNQIPVLTAGKTFILGYTNEEHGIFKNLPVIIFDDFTTAIKYVDFPFKAKSSAMKMLLPKNEKINLRFIYEIMLQIKYQVADHKRHWIGEYSKIEIKVPSTPEEQNEIATILSDMDAEIQALETKLEKYRKIKLGMMQNLLTGKIRLI